MILKDINQKKKQNISNNCFLYNTKWFFVYWYTALKIRIKTKTRLKRHASSGYHHVLYIPRPKSPILISLRTSKNMLLGVRSRCMIPWLWTWARPSTVCRNRCHAWSTSKDELYVSKSCRRVLLKNSSPKKVRYRIIIIYILL